MHGPVAPQHSGQLRAWVTPVPGSPSEEKELESSPACPPDSWMVSREAESRVLAPWQVLSDDSGLLPLSSVLCVWSGSVLFPCL